MSTSLSRFQTLSTAFAPGQEIRQSDGPPPGMRGARLQGRPVDFSHGDVNTDAFEPTPGAFEFFTEGVQLGGEQAYTEYRGGAHVRELVADRLEAFTGAPVSAQDELIVTPGTQGALFLAAAAMIGAGDKVAIVRPDYFANRKIVEFLGGEVVPMQIDYLGTQSGGGLDLDALEAAFRSGVKVFLFSNPNNPTGVVYSTDEVAAIAKLASRYGVGLIVDQLYSRLLYPGAEFTHLRAVAPDLRNVVTIMGPSKTESLSGYRLGIAFGDAEVIDRMEKLQAIVSLRAPGYCQAVLRCWFAEPTGWLADRIERHRVIRDEIVDLLREIPGLRVRPSEAGSYVFPRLPALDVPNDDFVRILRIQAGVIVTPGTEFSPDSRDSIRLNFSQNRVAACDAVKRLAALVSRYAV